MPKRNPSSTPSTELVDSWGRRNRKHHDKACEHCGLDFRPKHSLSRYCSRKCAWANNGKNQATVPECWWADTKGYIQGFVRDGGAKVRVRLHRKIAEHYLVRPLLPSEDVHHINGDKKDNRPENLQVIDHKAHSSLSNRLRALAKAVKP